MKQQELEKKIDSIFLNYLEVDQSDPNNPCPGTDYSEIIKQIISFICQNFIPLEEIERVIEDFKIKNTPKPDYSSKKPMDSMSYNSALTDLKQNLIK